jgi:hypothetical protein
MLGVAAGSGAYPRLTIGGMRCSSRGGTEGMATYARAVAVDPNYASNLPASLLIRTAYQAMRVDDSIVQVQGDRAYLARSEEPRVSRRHSGSSASKTAPARCRGDD